MKQSKLEAKPHKMTNESVETKIRIYESYDAGIITESEKNQYLEMLNVLEAKSDEKSIYTGYKSSGKSIAGVSIGLYDNDDSKEVLDSLNTNYAIVNREYKKYLNDNFIKWLKPENYDADKNTVMKGLKIVEITYGYHHIIAKYSPTGKDDYFGQFEFMIEPSNSEAKKVFDVSNMELTVKNGKILKCFCYDV